MRGGDGTVNNPGPYHECEQPLSLQKAADQCPEFPTAGSEDSSRTGNHRRPLDRMMQMSSVCVI
jgi:hypothetical protein